MNIEHIQIPKYVFHACFEYAYEYADAAADIDSIFC